MEPAGSSIHCITRGLASTAGCELISSNPMDDAQDTAIRHISDTALLVAIYRARESERPDAHFNDPFARRLAGERGEKIAADMHKKMSIEWPMVARTVSIDKIVYDAIRDGADMVINL